ncbi:MAG: hypothetical protein FD123_1261 [Bacteroidetes bacterium]|nr:MAG: hypothetical protein FD123_1261 [Bacteroidota bacterium]
MLPAQSLDSLLVSKIELHRYDEAKELVEKGANVNTIQHFQTPLTAVVNRMWDLSDTVFYSWLLSKGAAINFSPGGYTGTSMYAAASSQTLGSRAQIVRFLIRNGAKVNVDEGQPEPIKGALTYNCWDVISVLMDNGAKLPSYALAKAMAEMRYSKYKDAQGALTEYGKLVEKLVNDSLQLRGRHELFTPLGHAIKNGNLEITTMLLQKGAPVDKVEGPGGWSSVMLASYKQVAEKEPADRLAIIQLLVQKGANAKQDSKLEYQQKLTHHPCPVIPKGSNALDAAILSGAPQPVIDYLKTLGVEQVTSKK